MDNSHLKYELGEIAQAVSNIQQGFQQLDLLELEILRIKALFKEQEEKIRSSICRTADYMIAEETYKTESQEQT